MHIANQSMCLKSTKAILKGVYKYYYGVIALFLRVEDRGFNFIANSGCFSSKYLTIVAKIRDVVVTRGDQVIIGDEEGGCARIAISPSFPNLLYTVCRS